MDREDIDATPRVLRVRNPESQEKAEDVDGLSQFDDEKAAKFSLRSLSASLSSIWARRKASTSNSCPQSESSQDQSWSVAPDLNLDLDDSLPSRSCVSFSTFTTRKSSSRALKKKRLSSQKDIKTSSQTCSSVSKPTYRHLIHPQTVHRRFPIDVEDESSLYSFASFSTDHSSRHSRKAHHDPAKRQPYAVGQTISSTMASNLPNGVYMNGFATDAERQAMALNNHVTAHAVQAPAFQDILRLRDALADEAFETPSFRTPSYQHGPLVNGETVPSAPPPTLASAIHTQESVDTPIDHDHILPQSDVGHFRDNYGNFGGSYHRNPLRHPPPARNIRIAPLPAIAALKVETFAFNVLETGAKSTMATYVTFDLTAVKQNNIETQGRGLQTQDRSYLLMENNEGSLIDLRIQTNVNGPASKLFEVGVEKIHKLCHKDRWSVLLKLGAKENTLRSRLSSSLRSDTRATSSLSLIDQFLASLKMDGKRGESVSVEAVIKYRHAFLPDDTTLETRAVCHVGSLASASSMDAIEAGVLASSIVHALDPGVNTVKLLSVERSEQQHHLELGGAEALALIYDFRHALGHVVSESVTWDLAVLETYYRQVQVLEFASPQTSTPRDTLRRRVATVAKRFSPRKSGGAGPGAEGRVE
ncbi:hypothetical protein AYO20_04410 [Fonsecaea nubica]|uniref:Uncharacterized protein n=1 Tax=Fonsecaea nubica TaxID=856822 RepID=A0A178D3Y1_9EURO|nr:hypothetical protein AYO20_04410 [Fonsecaea nubica]OAL36252.1 hypothetical protein AYO20_04410 [Fonsecaea nubica]